MDMEDIEEIRVPSSRQDEDQKFFHKNDYFNFLRNQQSGRQNQVFIGVFDFIIAFKIFLVMENSKIIEWKISWICFTQGSNLLRHCIQPLLKFNYLIATAKKPDFKAYFLHSLHFVMRILHQPCRLLATSLINYMEVCRSVFQGTVQH